MERIPVVLNPWLEALGACGNSEPGIGLSFLNSIARLEFEALGSSD